MLRGQRAPPHHHAGHHARSRPQRRRALQGTSKGKEQMIEAIAAERHAREREIILEARREGGYGRGPPDLNRPVRASIARSARPQGAQDGDAMVDGGAAEPAHSQNRFARGVDEPRRMLAAIVTRARDNGEMPKDIDPDAMARVLIALFQGFALQLAWDPRIDPKPFANAIERLFAAILSPRLIAMPPSID